MENKVIMRIRRYLEVGFMNTETQNSLAQVCRAVGELGYRDIA
jgi:hypothetical protein